MINQPHRVLRTFDATAMVTGNMIGSGIFLLAGFAAGPVSTGFVLLSAWVFGGIMALLGAFAISELATRFPHSGGDFLYLRRVYGHYPAFLYGWMSLMIFGSGSIAILALFSSKYFIQIIPFISSTETVEKLIASFFIVFYTVLHGIKVIVGARFQSILTILKIIGIFLLSFLLYSGIRDFSAIAPINTTLGNPVQGFSRALIPIFFAYTGWNVAGYIAGEISNPRKTLPIALIGGTTITIILYLILTGAFLDALGIDGMRNDALVPQTALNAVSAGNWSPFLLGLIFLSIVSSLSIAIQSGARVIQSMGEHGVFFHKAADIHPKYDTPVISFAVQGFWAIALIYILEIESLVDSTTVVMILFSGLTISTLFFSRKKRFDPVEESKDYYRSPFYPSIPIAYIISAIFISSGVIKFYLSQNSYLPIWGFIFLVVGTTVYIIWKRATKGIIGNNEN